MPRVSFDFDSFSFHVPSIGSAAYSAPAAKINAKLSAMVLVFISASSRHFRRRSMLFVRKALQTNHFKKWNVTIAHLRGYRTLVLSTLLIFLDNFVQ
jgi:hypothetical protein